MLVARPGHHAGGPGHQQARLGATWTTAGADEEGIAAALTAKGILSAAGSRSSRPSAVHFNNKNQTMVTVSGGVCVISELRRAIFCKRVPSSHSVCVRYILRFHL